MYWQIDAAVIDFYVDDISYGRDEVCAAHTAEFVLYRRLVTVCPDAQWLCAARFSLRICAIGVWPAILFNDQVARILPEWVSYDWHDCYYCSVTNLLEQYRERKDYPQGNAKRQDASPIVQR